jgi:hypothetical protein
MANKCPCCKNTKSKTIQIHTENLEQNIFSVRFIGRIDLRVCCECGSVFIDDYYLKKLKEEEE